MSNDFKHGTARLAKHQAESQDHERGPYRSKHRRLESPCNRSIAWSSPSASFAWLEMFGGVELCSSSFRTELMPRQNLLIVQHRTATTTAEYWESCFQLMTLSDLWRCLPDGLMLAHPSSLSRAPTASVMVAGNDQRKVNICSVNADV